MYDFKLFTQLHQYDDLGSFINEFNIGHGDLIITNEVIYKNSFEKHSGDWKVLFQEKYGYGEPSDVMLNKIMEDMQQIDYQRIVAVGGGTVIDVGKIVALGGTTNVRDLLYGTKEIKREKELIVIPTTCGTGSEVTNVAILEDTTAGVKKGIVHQDVYPTHAVLIPELLRGLPFKFFSFSSVDALIHAIESYLAPKSNPITELFGIKAMELILTVYKKIAEQGEAAAYENIDQVLLGSTYAGIAFANTGVGAVHALSYPLGGKYHVPHGEANYAMFDAVMRKYDMYNPEGKLLTLKRIIADGIGIQDPANALVALSQIIDKFIPRKTLREYGVQSEELSIFTDNALGQERLMKNNYVPLSKADVYDIYKELY